MKTKYKVAIAGPIIGLIEAVVVATIGAKWGKDNFIYITQAPNGEEIEVNSNNIQTIVSEKETLEEQISDYESRISELESEKEELSQRLDSTSGELNDLPTVEYHNLGLSIDGEETTINEDKSCALINGRQYYSQEFVDNLLPDDKSAIIKDDTLYIGKVVKDKSNLLEKQIIDISGDVEIWENTKDTYGNMREKSVVFKTKGGSIAFNANREYSNLKFTIAVVDGKKGSGMIQIESEQGNVFMSEEILSTTEPVEMDVPINQASKIVISDLNGEYSKYIMITDAVLYNEE